MTSAYNIWFFLLLTEHAAEHFLGVNSWILQRILFVYSVMPSVLKDSCCQENGSAPSKFKVKVLHFFDYFALFLHFSLLSLSLTINLWQTNDFNAEDDQVSKKRKVGGQVEESQLEVCRSSLHLFFFLSCVVEIRICVCSHIYSCQTCI